MLPAWIPQLSRGLLALALGIVIVFTLEHTPAFGLATFGAFAVLSGGVLLVGTLRGDYGVPVGATLVAQGIVTVAAGVVALALVTAGPVALGLVLGGWGLVAGALEMVSGIRARGRSPIARDWILGGALTLVLGLVALVFPAEFSQAFSGDKGVQGVLTGPVVIIGVLGAWAMLVGVLQTISAVSLRGAARPVSA